MTRAIGLLAILLLCLGQAPGLAAQEDPRVLFERGTQAVEEGRFADAQPDLERSLAIAPRPATAFNLIVALDGVGRLVLASEVCRALVAGEHGELSEPQRAEAVRTCDELGARLARLIVFTRGDAPLEIRVDGRLVGQVAAGARLEVVLDPGWHHVRASPGSASAGAASVERSVSLEAGPTELELELGAAGTPPPREIVAPTSSGPDVGLVLGLTLGAAALAGAAITIGVVLSAGGPEPMPGDFRVVMTLTLP